MSLAEPVSKPSVFLTRLAVLLRRMPLVQLVLARLASRRGIPVARGETAEPPLLGEPCGSHRDALDLSCPAPPPVNQADAPAAEMMVADPAVVEQAEADLLVDDPPLAASPAVDQPFAPSVVDQAVADTPVAEATLAFPAIVEQALDDQPVDDPPLSTPPVVDQADADAPAATATVADPLVLEPAVDDRMADDLSLLDPVAANLPSDQIRVEPELDLRSERERLIRRRWMETGIKMWNPDFNGAGRATLNIQGRAGLLPILPGETISRYDTLQFKQVEHGIVCEGVVVEAPRRRK